MIHSGEINIRLPGIPVDTHPYVKFIRSLGQRNLLFTPVPPVNRTRGRWPSREVELVNLVTEIRAANIGGTGGLGISGIVAKNPFFKNSGELAKWSKSEDLLAFAEPEYLICTLDDWLDVGDEVDGYVITSLEMVTIGEAVLLHPRCTWKKLIKRIDPSKREGALQIKSEWQQ